MVVYYIDYSKGTDAAPAVNPNWGQKFSGIIDSSADVTHFVDAALTVPAGIVNDSYNDAFFYNVTRSLSAYVSDYDDGSTTITLDGAIAGMAAGDEYYLIMSYKTLAYYTTTTIRTAGDIAYVRAGTTETLAATVPCDEDGTPQAPISIIGTADGTTNLEATLGITAWQDGATAMPIIDGNNGAYYILISSDDFWTFKYLDIRNTNSATYGCLHMITANGIVVDGCRIRDAANAGGYNLNIFGTCSNIKILNTTILNGNYMNIYVGATTRDVYFYNCQIKGGDIDGAAGLGTTYGIVNDSSNIVFDMCIFGGDGVDADLKHTTCDILFNGISGLITCRNTKFNSSTKIGYYSATLYNNILIEEDAGQIGGAQLISGKYYTLSKTTTINNTAGGGAESSVKVSPIATLTSGIGINNPITVSGRYTVPDFRVWASTTPSTISIYIRTYSSWVTYPTTAELWVEAEYVSSSSGYKTKVTSAAAGVLATTETWTKFACAVAPAVPSFVNLKTFLALASSSAGIYVDIKPVIS